jgi:SAM-dependent methyltransferase
MSDIKDISRDKPELADCMFYHSVDLPSGEQSGLWDLRGNVDRYLGETDFAGKSVLEIGPASGFLSYHMEQKGAAVTAVEPSMERLWDTVPLESFAIEAWRRDFTQSITGVRSSFWYLHHHHGSKVRLIEADTESLPQSLGRFDIGVLANILLHTRSPISIMENVARHVTDKIIVTELYDANLGELPICRFLPKANIPQVDTWWAFTPAFFKDAFAVMGFAHSKMVVHHQRRQDGELIPMFTIVASRRPLA